MNFDDLQKTWGEQRFGDDATLRAVVLEKIRVRERQFRWLVTVGMVREAGVIVILISIVVSNWQGVRLPSLLALAAGVFFMVGLVAMLKLSKSLTGELLGGAGALAEQVGRDRTRFRRMMLWGNGRELVACLCAVWCFGVNAVRAGDHPGLRWGGVAFLTITAGALLGRMLLIEWRRPHVNDTVASDLNLTIHYVRAQLQLVSNLWWYVAPVFGAVGCLKLIRVVDGEAPVRSFAISMASVAAVLWFAWKLNRKLAEARLRPRAEFLERLRDELANPSGTNSRRN